MAKVEKFEDLRIWQEARALCKALAEVWTRPKFAKDFSLVNQLNSSSGSVMDNIAEGFDRGGNKEFIHFLSIARGSCSEVRSQLYRARDRAYISEAELDRFLERATSIGKGISSLMSYLRKSDYKGSKFKEPSAVYYNPEEEE